MKLTLAEIFKFGDCTVSSRNFVEGEHVLQSNHVLKCGKVTSNSESSVNLLAYCLQTSDLKGRPHEIRADIGTDGQIIKCECSCKAGLSQKCKHVLAVLLYCYRHDIDKLENLSSTDVKCVWKDPQRQTIEQYKATRVKDHDCYSKLYKGCEAISVSDEQVEMIKKLSLFTGENAFSKHIVGRHQVLEVNNNSDVMDENVLVLEAIVNHEESEIMRKVSQVCVSQMRDCCHQRLIDYYNEDYVAACIDSEHSLPEWLRLRQFRITGSRIYKIYTYSFNKTPNWEKKSLAYFYPRSFRNKFTDHGKKYEKVAIEEYEKFTQTKVTTCGCVISKLNAWMAYSPDGIVMKDDKPSILIEVKCPFAGKTSGITNVLAKLTYLKIDQDNTATFKERHEYYCQIQMGMALLNVKSTDFIIYASHDSSFVILNVPLNESYILNVLTVVKKSFCNQILHYLCIKENENVQDNSNTLNNQ